MASHANVRSVDALKRFRAALLRFCEVAERALGEADNELSRTLDWVDSTQSAHWRREIASRTEDISTARAAVFRREIRSTSDTPGATEERKELTAARVRLREAEDRTRTVKAWSRRLREEADRYYATVERLSGAVHTELPEAAVRLGRMIENLEAYLAITGPAADGPAGAAARSGEASLPAAGSSMSRSGAAASPKPAWWPLRTRAGQIGTPPPLAPPVTGAPAPQEPIDASDLMGRIPGVALQALPAGATIVVEEGALAQREYFLLRRASQEHPEGEWVVGLAAAEAPVRQPVRVPAATLARRLGANAGVLLLPRGWIILFKEGQIRLIADAEDRERLVEEETVD